MCFACADQHCALQFAGDEVIRCRIEHETKLCALHPTRLAGIDHLGPQAAPPAFGDQELRGGALAQSAIRAEYCYARDGETRGLTCPERQFADRTRFANVDNAPTVLGDQGHKLRVIGHQLVQAVSNGEARLSRLTQQGAQGFR